MKSVNLVASLSYQGKYNDGDFIGVDKGAKYLIEKNIKMIAVVGDFDSLDKNSQTLLEKMELNLIKLDPIKDNTDLDVAIAYANKLGYQEINIYGAIGARLDHTLLNLNLLKKNPHLVFYDDTSKIKVLKKGYHEIEKGEFKYYSFFALKECFIDLKNFKYPLDKYVLKLDDTLCISNELKENASINTSEDIIVVMSK